MSIWRVGSKKNRLINVCIVFQLSLAMIVTILLISSIKSKTQYYEPFRNYFEGRGDFGILQPVVMNNHGVGSMDVIKKNMKNVKSIAGCYIVNAGSPDYKLACVCYDDEIEKKFKPSLKSGKWISNDKKEMEAVITDNAYGLKTGDTIELWSQSNDIYTFTIVGTLNSNAPIPGMMPSGSFITLSYKTFYNNYNYNYENRPALILPNDTDMFDKQVAYQILIKYNDNITDDEIKENRSFIFGVGGLIMESMSTINKNSQEIIKSEIFILLPIVIAILILITISTVSISAIAVKSQLKNYSIYYMCGLSWKKCTKLSLYRTAVTCISAVALTAFALRFMDISPVGKDFILEIQLDSVLISLSVILFYFAVSFIMPFAIINKTSPVQIFKSN